MCRFPDEEAEELAFFDELEWREDFSVPLFRSPLDSPFVAAAPDPLPAPDELPEAGDAAAVSFPFVADMPRTRMGEAGIETLRRST